MAAKKRPGAVKRAVRRAKPYNNRLILLGFVADGLVASWACLDNAGLINPAIWGAVSALLKTANVAIHFMKTQGSADDGDQSDDK